MRLKFFVGLIPRLVLCLLAVALQGRPSGATTTALLQNTNTQTTAPAQQQNCPQPSNPPSGQPATAANKNCPADPKGGNKPAPLFSGSLTIKKSQQTTDNTALGFNGVDPNGQVQQAFLSAAPTADSTKKAQAMDKYRPSAAEIAAFESEGSLPPAPPAPTLQK